MARRRRSSRSARSPSPHADTAVTTGSSGTSSPRSRCPATSTRRARTRPRSSAVAASVKLTMQSATPARRPRPRTGRPTRTTRTSCPYRRWPRARRDLAAGAVDREAMASGAHDLSSAMIPVVASDPRPPQMRSDQHTTGVAGAASRLRPRRGGRAPRRPRRRTGRAARTTPRVAGVALGTEPGDRLAGPRVVCGVVVAEVEGTAGVGKGRDDAPSGAQQHVDPQVQGPAPRLGRGDLDHQADGLGVARPLRVVAAHGDGASGPARLDGEGRCGDPGLETGDVLQTATR